MIISFRQSAGGAVASGSPATTSAIKTTKGNALIAAISTNVAGTLSISDSFSNGWTQIGTSLTVGATGQIALFYSLNITGGSGHTVSAASTGTTPNLAISVQEFFGLATISAFDQTVKVGGSGATADSGNAPTTTYVNELIIGAGVDGGGNGLTVGAGFSNLSTQADGGSTTVVGIESKKVDSIGAYNSTMGINSAGNWGMITATFISTSTSFKPNPLRAHAFSPGIAR
jgi:hypothetical protein